MGKCPLNKEEGLELAVGITDHIIAFAHRQKGLEPGTPFMLANIMEMVSEFSEPTTSHLAFITTLVNKGTNIVSIMQPPFQYIFVRNFVF
jgi:hypothetical protein